MPLMTFGSRSALGFAVDCPFFIVLFFMLDSLCLTWSSRMWLNTKHFRICNKDLLGIAILPVLYS